MTMRSISINGWPVELRGMQLAGISPWLSGPSLTRAVTAMPGYSGGLPSPFATVAARVVTIESIHQPATMAERMAMLDRYADDLSGLLEIETIDAPGRVLRGTYQAQGVEVSAPRFVELSARVTAEILCVDGAKYDTHPSAVALSTTPRPIPLGTLSSTGIVRLRGGISGTRIVTYRGVNGNVLGQIGVNMTVSASEFVDVDLTLRRIRLVSAVGIASDAYAAKRPADRWFALHRSDGNAASLAWPTLELDGGTGVFYYARAWGN